MVPPEGLEPSPHRLRAEHAALTLRRRWSFLTGSNRDLALTKRAGAPCTPRKQWSGLSESNRYDRVGGPTCWPLNIKPAWWGCWELNPGVTAWRDRFTGGVRLRPHHPRFGLRVSHPPLRAGNARCYLHTQADLRRLRVLSKRRQSTWRAGRDSNSGRTVLETGIFAARPPTHRCVSQPLRYATR